MENPHCTQASPVLPAPRASLAGEVPWESSEERGHLGILSESEHPAPLLPARAVDLFSYIKIMSAGGQEEDEGSCLLSGWPCGSALCSAGWQGAASR